MAQDLTDDKSLVQVKAWCRQATSHYLNQCWPRSPTPYGVTRPKWINQACMYMPQWHKQAQNHAMPVASGIGPTFWSDSGLVPGFVGYSSRESPVRKQSSTASKSTLEWSPHENDSWEHWVGLNAFIQNCCQWLQREFSKWQLSLSQWWKFG